MKIKKKIMKNKKIPLNQNNRIIQKRKNQTIRKMNFWIRRKKS